MIKNRSARGDTLSMRQKTKNHRNQGSNEKKMFFLYQSRSRLPRWVHVVQKTRAKNSHAWAPLILFFYFWRRFLRVWLKSLKKMLIWPKKICFEKNQKRYQKTQNLMLISNLLKGFKKIHQKKVISKTSSTKMSKSGKSAYFRHIFANNFFW